MNDQSEDKELDAQSLMQQFEDVDEVLTEHFQGEMSERQDEWRVSVENLALPVWNGEILPALKANAVASNKTKADFHDQWLRTWKLTMDLFQAVHNHGTFEKKPWYFWEHQDYDFLRANDATRGIEIDKGALLDVAAGYLSRPEIRSNKFDWILMDSIVFQELDAYTYHVVNSKSGTGANWAAIFAGTSHSKYRVLQLLFWPIGIALCYVAPAAFAYWLATNDYHKMAYGVIGFWGLSLLLRLVGFPARWRARKKSTKILTQMLDMYRILGNSVISPTKLKECLEKAAAVGAVFDGALFSLVDRMAARDATAFIPSQIG